MYFMKAVTYLKMEISCSNIGTLDFIFCLNDWLFLEGKRMSNKKGATRSVAP